MMSLYTLKSASDAFTYYQQGDYYTSAGTKEYSFWFGKGAKTLNLKGPVDFKTFEALLEGRLPDATMIQTQKGQHHRPGYDLTFSAPKSVSILALVLGNKEVLDAHRQAVKGVLMHLEKEEAAFRLKIRGETHIQKSGNYTVAIFEHSDSRAGDPNLHSHTVLMNMTQRADGAWRALYADNLYSDKLLHGMEYRSLLARELLQQGFELEFKPKGLFEIVGVPEPLMQYWSTRREEIEQWLKEHDVSGGEASAKANFQTRKSKGKQNVEARMETWIKELNAQGFTLEDLQRVVYEAKARGPVPLPDIHLLAERAVDAGFWHLSERHLQFSIEKLIKTAKWMSVLSCGEGDLLQVIEKNIQAKTLLYVAGKKLTTPENFALQQKMLASLKDTKGSVNRILAPWMAELLVGFRVKGSIERQALKALLISTQRQMLVSAYSREALFNLLKPFKILAEHQGYYPRFLTQTQGNVETLKEKLGTERVTTLAGFLLSCEKRAEQKGSFLPVWLKAWDDRIKAREARDIWVVQGSLSVREVSELQTWAKRFHARILFTQTQHQSVSCFKFLKEHGLPKITLHTQGKTTLSSNMALLDIVETLEKKGLLQSIAEDKARYQKAVEAYDVQSQLVVANPIERHFLNQSIRVALKEKGLLQGQGEEFNILRPLGLTQAEKHQIQLYQLQDVLRFNEAQPKLGIEKGEYFTIKAVHLALQSIHLQNASGKTLDWKLQNATQVDVFRPEKRELMLGERLIWTRTLKAEEDKSLSQIKNQFATVKAIDGNHITVVLENGREVSLNTTDYQAQHWDYGYVTLLKEVSFGANTKIIALLNHRALDNKAISEWQALLSQEGCSVVVFTQDGEKLKHILRAGVETELSLFPQEVSYKRHEALLPTTATQIVFDRLQKACLEIWQRNPEFLERNLEQSLIPKVYSPEFKKACFAVETVILYLSEREAVFPLKTLKQESRELGGLTLSHRMMEGAIGLAIKKGWLVKIPSLDAENVLVAGRHTILMEKLCVQKMRQGKNQLTPILARDAPSLKAIQASTRLTQGQKDAITLMLSSPATIAAVQGIAGAGKTTALKEVKRLCDAANVKTLVLANTASAKAQASITSGIASLTTAQFLTRVETLLATDVEQAKQAYGNNSVIIVDEASLVATREQLSLITLSEKLGARLRFIGDFKQQGSIGAGTSLFDTLVYGVDKAVMTENVRLKEPKALEAMKKAYAGDMAGTLSILKDTIEEIPDKKEALTKIVDIYMGIKKGREEVLIITPLNEDRRFINNAIRERLIEARELTGVALKTSVFLPKDMREVDKHTITQFQLGDIIRFNTHYSRLGIRAGDYLTVTEIDAKHQRLTITNNDKQSLYWTPKNLNKTSDIEVYSSETRELMKNDIITFKRNQNDKEIFNGDKAKVLKIISDREVEVLLANGKTLTLDLSQKENQHLDYGYALTVFAVQGKEGVLVLAYGEGPKPYLKKTQELKVGDIAILTKEDQKSIDPSYLGNAAIGEVIKIKGSKITFVKDRKPLTMTADKDCLWGVFPSFETRKDRELPLSTSQQSFLVQITRGDLVYLIVPYLKDFIQTLERHEAIKQSALSLLDPERIELNQAVKRLVSNISGIAEVQASEVSKLKKSVKEPRPKYVDREQINRYLESDVLGYASRWLGSPKKISSSEARWPGALTVNIRGATAGLWKRWSTGEGGKDLISLYASIYNLSWKEAIQELAKDFGLVQERNSFYAVQKPAPVLKKEVDKGAEEARQFKIKRAQKMYARALPIKGTLGEKYLRDCRGIIEALPADFRFVPEMKHWELQQLIPALIAPIRDKHQVVTGIVRIFLNSDGSKLNQQYRTEAGTLEKATNKANFGVVGEGAVTVQRGELGTTLWIAEGIETALSIAVAVPNQTVVASLSVDQLRKVPVGPEIQKVVICADKDEAGSQTLKAVVKAIEHHLSQGRRVFIAIPEVEGKCDFNDLLKQGGVESVRTTLENKLEIKSSELSSMKEVGLLATLTKMREPCLPERMPVLPALKPPTKEKECDR